MENSCIWYNDNDEVKYSDDGVYACPQDCPACVEVYEFTKRKKELRACIVVTTLGGKRRCLTHPFLMCVD